MRISDWSSDVCSSDLERGGDQDQALVDRALLDRQQAQHRGLVEGIAAQAPDCLGGVGDDAAGAQDGGGLGGGELGHGADCRTCRPGFFVGAASAASSSGRDNQELAAEAAPTRADQNGASSLVAAVFLGAAFFDAVFFTAVFFAAVFFVAFFVAFLAVAFFAGAFLAAAFLADRKSTRLNSSP